VARGRTGRRFWIAVVVVVGGISGIAVGLLLGRVLL
jgi:hypothetical protein